MHLGNRSVIAPGLWVGFIVFVLAMLALDLGVFHRKAHEVTLQEARRLERGLGRARAARSTSASTSGSGAERAPRVPRPAT